MSDPANLSLPFDQSGFDLDSYAPYLMNRIMGRYNANLRGEMAALGLSTAKMRALATLSARDGLKISELGVFAVVEQSTLSRALEALERDGMVSRREDPEDLRANRIFLTEGGRKAFARLWPHMQASLDHMFEGIGARECAAFLTTLQKMLANVRVHEI